MLAKWFYLLFAFHYRPFGKMTTSRSTKILQSVLLPVVSIDLVSSEPSMRVASTPASTPVLSSVSTSVADMLSRSQSSSSRRRCGNPWLRNEIVRASHLHLNHRKLRRLPQLVVTLEAFPRHSNCRRRRRSLRSDRALLAYPRRRFRTSHSRTGKHPSKHVLTKPKASPAYKLLRLR